MNKSITHWSELPEGGVAYALAELIKVQHKPVWVLTETAMQAEQLAQTAGFFLGMTHALPVFPDWETLPYDHFSPHQGIVSDRIEILYGWARQTLPCVFSTFSAVLHKLPPPSYLRGHHFDLAINQTLDLNTFKQQLILAGYRMVNSVYEHGEVAVRGSIIDLYPMGSDSPYRIELFDDQIESIRFFEPETQRSTDKINQIQLLTGREYPLTEDSITQFRRAWRARFTGNPTACPIYESISEGIAPNGIEYYMPLFFDNLVSFTDYLPRETLILKIGDLDHAGRQLWQEFNSRYEQLSHDVTQPILKPSELLFTVEDCLHLAKQFEQPRPPALNLTNLTVSLDNLPTGKKIFLTESPGRREVLKDLLKEPVKSVENWHQAISSQNTCITVAPVISGFEIDHIPIITESELFTDYVPQARQRRGKSIDPDLIIKDLAELKIGAPIVHLTHGIGRYQGLQSMTVNNIQNEFLVLTYANNDKIYVPVTALHAISRYSGGDLDSAPLHKLGSGQWDRAKQKAEKQVSDIASELLALYAERAAHQGIALNQPDQTYQQFISNFPFEETQDQQKAIDAVISDLCSNKPMDRLICGDVGFGKTEVAMRAAFLVVSQQRQVAMLVPTTLLAEQHYENFCDRFADVGVNIDHLSRFRSSKEQFDIISKLSAGKIDILIGTHKLLQSTINFRNLGLVIIDEEHRFGVKQKEALKKLRTEIDILSLTATPIPRSLNMAMSGIRDVSIIATPPAKRLPIKTFWQRKKTPVIREAILREVLRGGQVFYLHNNVKTIANITDELRQLIPDAKIDIAHGQMRERNLEKVMSDFYHRKFNVLVCTTIIETGIDIPTANTIIIERADKFGLGQLHQIRGRVGRSHHQAYAYLLTPEPKSLTKDAVRRMEAITAYDDLGAGFMLATHDLEIRGAGELLGDNQSGNLHAIGFSLYMDLLNRAVKDLKAGKIPNYDLNQQTGCEIKLNISALFPTDYIPDIHLRLTLYKRLADCSTEQKLKDLQIEFIDRFGPLPAPAKDLIRQQGLKYLAEPLGIRHIDGNKKQIKLSFTDKPKVNPETIIRLIQTQPDVYQLNQKQQLIYLTPTNSAKSRIDAVIKLLGDLRD